MKKKPQKNLIHKDFSFILPLFSFLVKTRFHNLYLIKFFDLYQRTDPNIYSADVIEILRKESDPATISCT